MIFGKFTLLLRGIGVRKFAPSDDLLKVFGSLSGMLDSSSYSACACDFVLDCIGAVYHNHEAIDEMLSDVNKQGTNMVEVTSMMDAITVNYELRSQTVPVTVRNELLESAEERGGQLCIRIDVGLDIIYTTWVATMKEGDAVLEATFNAFDKNRDGKLSLQEFNAIVQEVEHLRYGDKRPKRVRTEREFIKMYQHAIDESDISDGTVSLAGFLTVARFFGLGLPTRQATNTQRSRGPLAAITEAATMSQLEREATEQAELAAAAAAAAGAAAAAAAAAAASEEAAEQAEAEALHAEGTGPELPYDRPDTVITLEQMRQFALDCKAFGPALSLAGLARICHTVSREPLPKDDAKQNATLREIEEASNRKPTDVHHSENEMHIYEFTECVLRISCNIYGGVPTECSSQYDTTGQLLPRTDLPFLTQIDRETDRDTQRESTLPCADCLERFVLEHILPYTLRTT